MSDATADNLTFEEALAELEQIVHDLEDGSTGLEESLARYEKGVGLIKRCYGQLRQAEQRVLLLAGIDADGEPQLQAFDAAPPDSTRAPARRAVRKKDDDVPF